METIYLIASNSFSRQYLSNKRKKLESKVSFEHKPGAFSHALAVSQA